MNTFTYIGSGTELLTYMLQGETTRMAVCKYLYKDVVRITIADFLYSGEIIELNKEQTLQLSDLLKKLLE